MENLTLYLTIAQGAVFIAYVTYVVNKFGIPDSISDTWYLLGRNGILFSLFCSVLGACMLYQGNDKTMFFVFSGVGLAFVGGATMFKWQGAYTDRIHYAGASIGIGCALGGLWLDYGDPRPMVVFIPLAILIGGLKPKNAIFWMEIWAFVCIILGLALRFI